MLRPQLRRCRRCSRLRERTRCCTRFPHCKSVTHYSRFFIRRVRWLPGGAPPTRPLHANSKPLYSTPRSLVPPPPQPRPRSRAPAAAPPPALFRCPPTVGRTSSACDNASLLAGAYAVTRPPPCASVRYHALALAHVCLLHKCTRFQLHHCPPLPPRAKCIGVLKRHEASA
jgi:hypothetical protein